VRGEVLEIFWTKAGTGGARDKGRGGAERSDLSRPAASKDGLGASEAASACDCEVAMTDGRGME